MFECGVFGGLRRVVVRYRDCVRVVRGFEFVY